jgi:3-isopropylmalate dehydrogenase
LHAIANTGVGFSMTTPYRLGLLNGDGIGAEIVPAARRVVDSAIDRADLAPIQWTQLFIGHEGIREHGDPIDPSVLESLAVLDGWVLGPHDSESYPPQFVDRLNPSGAIRKHFDLYANIRPARSYPDSNAIVPGTDLVIVRQNTEGFYGDRNTFAGTGEYMPTPDVAIVHGIVTRAATELIAHEAFRLARTRSGRLTIVHKANVLRMTMGLFRSVVREVGERDYPDVTVDDFHIDAMMVHLVRRANEFDVIVAENMMGDILSDLTGELAGSLGMAPSLNASRDHAMAQATHGSAPDIAGQGVANPAAVMLSSAMLLRWLGARSGDAGLERAGALIDGAVEDAIRSGTRTRDLGGTATTDAFTEAVLSSIDVLSP